MLTPLPPRIKLLRSLAVYACLIGTAIAAFYVVTTFGERAMPARLSSAVQVIERATPHTFMHLLLAMLAILMASSALAAVCRWIHQPPVIGEILAGICLGPSLLGRIAPEAQEFLLPQSVAPHLGTLSQVGVILFMFLVGLELDTKVLRKSGHATLAISHASIVVPFVLGTLASIWLFPTLAGPSVTFTVFALFFGVSLSVTAFPVLARILSDKGLSRSPMGIAALTCAAVDDVTAWCLLALLVGVAKASAWDAAITCGLATAYVLAVVYFARPFIERWVHGQEAGLSRSAVPVVLLLLLLSALITEFIGIHAIFGAFLLGAMIPHDSRVARALEERFQDLVVVLFMPAFFAFTGMRTQIGLLHGLEQWLICGVIVLIACVGKFGGSFVAGRMVGMDRRDASFIGILMNTRGLMELIVLNLGLDLGVISPTLFAMLVIMALVTTFMTTPLLRLMHGKSWADLAPAPLPVAYGASAEPRPGE